ncbi:hypothetical protein MUK42_37759 [Musa troglodytarum]|uniref:Uncharacterized protein n=1 Tax=Musa troglodytarum TaxID=320322 RepID=A0A9E7EDR6_9LILI|nr:hypothetical protein MUK42_37759 [Musa troglodytarum]
MARRRRTGAAVLCLVLLSTFWLFFDSRAVAIRTFPADSSADGRDQTPFVRRRPVPLGDSPPPGTAAAAAEGGGLEDTKRRVPSCPDPLHNR